MRRLWLVALAVLSADAYQRHAEALHAAQGLVDGPEQRPVQGIQFGRFQYHSEGHLDAAAAGSSPTAFTAV